MEIVSEPCGKLIAFTMSVKQAWSIVSIEPHSPTIMNFRLQVCNCIQRADERKNCLEINTHNWRSFLKAGVSRVSFTSITQCRFQWRWIKCLKKYYNALFSNLEGKMLIQCYIQYAVSYRWKYTQNQLCEIGPRFTTSQKLTVHFKTLDWIWPGIEHQSKRMRCDNK